MSLLDVQNFTARIYTDETLRREFLNAPKEVGERNNLTAEEIADLSEITPAELNFFADSLFYKRLREVEKLLPLTNKVLGQDFEKHFREFASQFLPAAIKKHLEDALRFAEFLQTKRIEPLWARDAAKFERAKLEFFALGKRFVFKKFDYDVREISRQNTPSPKERSKRKTFAAWLRIGNKSKHFIW